MTTTTWQPLPYKRREPRPPSRDLYAWALLIPALVYSLGVILYGGDVLLVGNEAQATAARAAGSWLMLIGGESGTVATAAEVFRKQREGDASKADWLGMLCSFGATFLTIVVIQARMVTSDLWWATLARAQGPLLFAIASTVDFYATVMEYGFYLASYNLRLARWEDGKHAHELRERERRQQHLAQSAQATAPSAQVRGNGAGSAQAADASAQIGAESARLATPSAQATAPSAQNLREPRRTATIDDWRELVRALSARELAQVAQLLQRPDTDRAGIVNAILAQRGFGAKKDSTARSWAAMLIRLAEEGVA